MKTIKQKINEETNGGIEDLRAALHATSSKAVKHLIKRTIVSTLSLIFILSMSITFFVSFAIDASTKTDGLIWMSFAGLTFGYLVGTTLQWTGEIKVLKAYCRGYDKASCSAMKMIADAIEQKRTT